MRHAGPNVAALKRPLKPYDLLHGYNVLVARVFGAAEQPSLPGSRGHRPAAEALFRPGPLRSFGPWGRALDNSTRSSNSAAMLLREACVGLAEILETQ